MSFTALPANNEHLFRYVFEEASLGIAVEDLDGTLLLANPALCSMLGFEKDGLCGMSCSQFTHPDDSQDDWALFQKLRAGLIDRYSLEKRYVRKDGAQIWGRLNVSLLNGGDGGTPLVFAFVEEITKDKLADKALRESEERLRLTVQAGRMYEFEWDAETDVIVRSGECKAILDWMDDPTRDTGRQFVTRVHPDDREAYNARQTGLTRHDSIYQTSYRVLRPDGSVIWLEARGHAWFDDEGRMLRINGIAADITARRRAERELSELSGRLIHAQEEERARIARELHDDFGQRMALFQVGFEQLQQDTAELSSKARQQFQDLAVVASELSSNIHDLAYQLHPSKLDTLGLVATLRSFCREFSAQHNLQVQFVHQDDSGQVPKDVSLCLFRIAQEALRNVVKHSGAAEAKVELSGHGDQIEICVSDPGVGFDPESAKGEAGLGFISMRERLRLVGGHLSIESEASYGTRIHARIPLSRTAGEATGDAKRHEANA